MARLKISARAARRVLLLLAHIYGQAGRWSCERLCHLTELQRRNWVAPKVALMGVVIFLPLPFGNVLSATSFRRWRSWRWASALQRKRPATPGAFQRTSGTSSSAGQRLVA